MSSRFQRDIKKRGRVFYFQGVNINYSFKSLENLAMESGAELAEGDIIVIDNENKTRRKAFKKTKNGSVIVYGLVSDKNKFLEVDVKSEFNLLDVL